MTNRPTWLERQAMLRKWQRLPARARYLLTHPPLRPARNPDGTFPPLCSEMMTDGAKNETGARTRNKHR